MSRFRTLIKEEVEYYFGPKKTKYVLIYSDWKGPSGDDKFIEEINVGDDLEKAKEKCKNLSIELNKLVDIYDYQIHMLQDILKVLKQINIINQLMKNK